MALRKSSSKNIAESNIPLSVISQSDLIPKLSLKSFNDKSCIMLFNDVLLDDKSKFSLSYKSFSDKALNSGNS